MNTRMQGPSAWSCPFPSLGFLGEPRGSTGCGSLDSVHTACSSPLMFTSSGHSQRYVCRGRREKAEHVPCLRVCSPLQGRPGAQAEQSPEPGPLDLTGDQVSALRAPQPSFVERRSATGHYQCCHLWEEDEEGQFGGLPMYLWGWTNHEGAQPDPRRCSRKWDRSRKTQLGIRKLGILFPEPQKLKGPQQPQLKTPSYCLMLAVKENLSGPFGAHPKPSKPVGKSDTNIINNGLILCRQL